MIEHVIKFTTKVDDKESHWLLQNGTSFEAAEKMLLHFLQVLGQLKAQQAAQSSPESSVEAEKPKTE